MITERLKFYADTPRGERNKLHCFKVNIFTLKDAYFRFLAQKYWIRAAWYETINIETGAILENSRLNCQDLFDEFHYKLTNSQRKAYRTEQHKYIQPK